MDEINELDSTCGVPDDELTKRFIEAVRIENEIKNKNNLERGQADEIFSENFFTETDGGNY